ANGAVLLSESADGRGTTAGTGGMKDAMVAALRGETRVVGTMLLGKSDGAVTTFDADEVRLFETLANQVSVALENGRLEHSLAQLKSLEQQLTFQAFHDSLTNLANRALFTERVAQAMAAAEDDGTAIAVLFIDLDDFKT